MSPMNTTRRSLLAIAPLALLPWTMSFGAPARPAVTTAAPKGELQVLATIPDLAQIAREIGGEEVEVTSIARGTENLHNVQIRPSTIVAASRADIFLQVGLALEHSWVPGLLQSARNKRIRPGAPGFVNCSVGFEPIQVPDSSSRLLSADVHPFGNPHINIDPLAGALFTDHIEQALITARPAREEYFRERAQRYREQLAEAAERWAKLGQGLAGKRAVLYHNEHDYLLRFLGIEVVAVLEVRPGVAPTPKHLAEVVQLCSERDVEAIVTSPWSNGSAVRNVAEKTSVSVVELPTMVDGKPGVSTWIGLIDDSIKQLRRGYGLPEEVE